MNTFFQENWLEVLQTVAIIASLIFTAVALRRDTKARHDGSIVETVKGHREVWKMMVENPNLERVMEKEVDLKDRPISQSEKWFVLLSILHLCATFESSDKWVKESMQGISNDIKEYFSNAIPRKVWEDNKKFQNPDFVEFVEKNMYGDS
jgi:putative exporter of polyketide antibiotics